MPNQYSPKPSVDAREMRGQAIAENFGWVHRIDDSAYMVHSQRLGREYRVEQTETGWVCECPDSTYRLLKCKHVWAVEISWTLRKRVEEAVVIQPVTASNCPKCGSVSLLRKGLRRNKHIALQKWLCRDCGYWFTLNLGFKGMRATPEIITNAMQIYFAGASFRGVRDFLKLRGVKFSQQSVWNWVNRYSKLMEGYLEQIRPQIGDTWRTDELYLKFKGNMKYLFAMMDDETRFRIAQQVSTYKGTSDVRPMFREAEARAGKRPKVLISDGASNFARACTKEWYSMHPERCTTHVVDVRPLLGTVHNNKMERQNGEWRDREKTFRSLKRADSPILTMMQINHNFIRPHMGLQGRTPAEAAGIKVEGENKWLTIIQNAAKSQVTKVDGENSEGRVTPT